MPRVSGDENPGGVALPVCAADAGARSTCSLAIGLPGACCRRGRHPPSPLGIVVTRRQSGTLTLNPGCHWPLAGDRPRRFLLSQGTSFPRLTLDHGVLFSCAGSSSPGLYALTSSAGHGSRAAGHGSFVSGHGPPGHGSRFSMTFLAVLVLARPRPVAGGWWARRSGSGRRLLRGGHRARRLAGRVAGTAPQCPAFTFVGGPGLFLVAGAGSLWDHPLGRRLTSALQCWAVGERVCEMVRRHGVLTPTAADRRPLRPGRAGGGRSRGRRRLRRSGGAGEGAAVLGERSSASPAPLPRWAAMLPRRLRRRRRDARRAARRTPSRGAA